MALLELFPSNMDLRREILGGITNFVSVAYFLIVVPKILSDAGIPLADAFIATALASGLATLVLAVYANKPFVLAPGIGLATFFTYTVVQELGVPWRIALAAIFIEGLLFFALTISKIRIWFGEGIPYNLRYAMISGVGLFLALIGLVQGGIISRGEHLFLRMSNLLAPAPMITILGFFIMLILILRRVRGSLLIGMIITTIIGLGVGLVHPYVDHDFSIHLPVSFMALDLPGLMNASILSIVLAFFMVDFFDTLGTATALLMKLQGGKLDGLGKVMISDAIGTTLAGLVGTSAITTYIESAAGVHEGAKTGAAAVITALLILASIFFYPLVELIPIQAVAPALIIVGFLMASNIRFVDFSEFEEAIPALIMFSLIPLTFSISHGIGMASIVYVVLKLAVGEGKEVHPAMYIIAFLFALDYLQVF